MFLLYLVWNIESVWSVYLCKSVYIAHRIFFIAFLYFIFFSICLSFQYYLSPLSCLEGEVCVVWTSMWTYVNTLYLCVSIYLTFCLSRMESSQHCHIRQRLLLYLSPLSSLEYGVCVIWISMWIYVKFLPPSVYLSISPSVCPAWSLFRALPSSSASPPADASWSCLWARGACPRSWTEGGERRDMWDVGVYRMVEGKRGMDQELKTKHYFLPWKERDKVIIDVGL